MNNTPLPVVLFDGPCGLCQRSVRFLLKHEREPLLSFASLQSEAGQHLLQEHGLPSDPDAMILIQTDSVLTGSNAALELCRFLRFPARLLRIFRVLPQPVHAALYRWVARRRYRWFGRDETCPLPDPDQTNRFLDTAEDLRKADR